MSLLIFPRAKPYGATQSELRGKISRQEAYPTTVIDYLKIDIYDSQANNPYNNIGAKDDGTIAKTIYLYLPNKLAEQYSTNYTNQKLGAVGAKAIGMVNGEGDFTEQIKGAAQSGKAQLGFKMGSDAINTVVSLTGGSSNLSANSLSALTQKRVFNPYEETTFEGMNFRTHNFNMKLVPKDGPDVAVIQEIIQTLRLAMLPGKGGDTGTWLTIPDFFRLSIVRYSDDGGKEKISKPQGNAAGLSNLFKFPKKMVLKDMSIDYSPDGNYASLMSHFGDKTVDYGPVSYQIGLTFAETGLLTKNDYDPNFEYNSNGEWNFDQLKIGDDDKEGEDNKETTETETGESE